MADHALNVVVGVDSSPDLEPQNVRAQVSQRMVSQHGLVAGSIVFNLSTGSQS